MAVILRSVVCFLALVTTSISISIPTPGSADHSLHHYQPSPGANEKPAGPFRKLRDSIIEKLWSIPSKPSQSSSYSSSRAPEHFRSRYGNDVVLRFQIRTEDEAKALSRAANILYLDIWEGSSNWVDIRVAKDVVPSFIGLLPPSLHESYTPLMHDLARAVYETYPSSSSSEESQFWASQVTSDAWKARAGPPQDLFFRDYQPLSVLYPWLRLMASLFPNHAELISIGKSAEGRDIPALRIGTQSDYVQGNDHDSRHTLIITGGSHAREWVSISSTSYVAYSLMTRYGHPQFPGVTKLLDHFDLVFVPVLNPDGYEYTWTTDRLWRKNRQATDISFCPGVDIDRSFEFGWDGHAGRDNPCSDDYAGTEPLMAVEARVLTEWARNETQNNNVTFVSYIDLHSYSQEVLYPYSYTCDIQPPNLEDLEEVAIGLAKSFRLTNGHYYGVESACEGSIAFQNKEQRTRFQTEQGGSALDFFYHEIDVKFAYQIKLRDTGTYGFLLPRSNIVPTGEEAYEALVGLGRWLLGNHGIEKFEDPDDIWGKEEVIALSTEQKAPSQSPTRSPDMDDEEFDSYAFELRRRRR